MDARLKERAEMLFPDKATYNLKETAAIMGVSPQTLYNNKGYMLGKRNTLTQIERATALRAGTRTRRQSNPHRER